jgi:hypothetical protein
VLGDRSLYGDAVVAEPATLGAAAFMNFGAYHTLAETVPIGLSVAADDACFHPSTSVAAFHKDFYVRVADLGLKYGSASDRVDIEACMEAHRQSTTSAAAPHCP